MALLPQDWLEPRREMRLCDFLDEPSAVWREARCEMRRLEQEMAAGDASPVEHLLDAYERASDLFESRGGWHREVEEERVRTVLRLEGLDGARKLGTLSCGERTRAGLARLLLTDASVHIFDEPTNHLDADGIAALQGWLAPDADQAWPKPFMLVSHDRDLLDSICTETWWVEHGNVEVFPGGITAFRDHQSTLREARQRAHAEQRREVARLESALRQRSAWAEKTEGKKYKKKLPNGRYDRDGMIDRGYVGARAARHQKRSKAVERRISKELNEKKVEAVWLEPPVKLEIPEPSRRTPDYLITARGLQLALGTKVLFEDFNFDLRAGERVALVGRNGSGKSSLLDALVRSIRSSSGRRTETARVPRVSGNLRVAPAIRCAYFEQELRQDVLRESALDLLDVAIRDHRARTLMGHLGISGEDALVELRRLSPGLRARVQLARVLLASPNLLLLDEPTNHLDLPMREALEDGLNAWAGTIVLVSHDRRFREALAAREVSLSA